MEWVGDALTTTLWRAKEKGAPHRTLGPST